MGVLAVIGAGAGRVLLCHQRDYDVWNLPGDGVEAGETPWDAVVREVKEETGLDAAVMWLAIVDYRPERDELGFTFACTALGGERTPNDGAEQLAYFEPDALPANTLPRHVGRVAPALSSGLETLLRVQCGPTSLELLRAQGNL
jgi:ADP-ribose pyrophosphatase YjhB (NUDIX family)